jgi:two-component system NtrC family sensor kinase
MNEKYTILAVDDTAEALALLVRILTPAGYQVRPADSGELALAAVAANPPDLILLDVRMEGLDGLEVCRRLKAREETRHIPIILVSAFADVKEWVEGLQLGAADFITKPVQPEELLTRVKTHLSLKQANISLKQQEASLRQTNEQLQAEISKCQRVEDELRQSLEQAARSHRAMLSALEDQKQAEEALQKAYKELEETYIQLAQAGKLTAMGEMAAGVVHELTQPLLGIKGFSTALLEDLKRNLPTEASQQAISDLEVILQQTERMVKLLSTIREFARASGTEMSPLDINKPLEAALLLFSEQLRLHNIVIGKNLARALPPVRGNANQLQQVFINLLANARDALDAKGGEKRLTVSTERSPKEASILIEVIDNGIGADAETLSKMFEPFFTARKAGDGTGTGLGLSIVARIIKEHKGTLDVQSEPGRGCKFSVRLPLSAK